MKKQTTFRKTIEKVWKNRAAIVIAIAATVFMCGLTALEFVALRMEWNLPVLAYVTGDSDSYIFEEYRSDEMKLDESTENVMLEEDMLQGESQSENSGKISHRVKARVRMILCQEKERTRMFGRKIQCRAKISRKKIRSSLLQMKRNFHIT